MPDSTSASHKSIDISSLSPFETASAAISKKIDPFGVTTSLLNAQMAWMMHPQELVRAASALSGDLVALQVHVMRRAMGMQSEDVIRRSAVGNHGNLGYHQGVVSGADSPLAGHGF